ncbi:MAG: hypothetical protein IJJ85_03275 [Clostridia bacterium]|nr:hypothetical protein [Clostridia bacterium]
MFGYASVNPEKLTPAQRLRYRAIYCGLCRRLGDVGGMSCRMALTYDFVLLVLVLAGVTGEAFEACDARCAAHPVQAHPEYRCRFTAYAADMDLFLAYEKLLDDKADDGGIKGAAAVLYKKQADRVAALYPGLCREVRQALNEIYEAERRDERNPEIPANAFGRLLGAIFSEPDAPSKAARYDFGFALGKAIYFLDAANDLHDDLRKLRYNPLVRMDAAAVDDALDLLLGETKRALDRMPLLQDRDLCENIILSGVWRHRRPA